MGTWICHLRVADKLLALLPGLDEVGFVFGNLAPDSGVPNEDGSAYDPPKEVTHFLQRGEDESLVRDAHFYRQYLAQIPRDDARYSFALGFFSHLVCDGLWARRIWRPTKHAHIEQYNADRAAFADAIKRDWYGLDHLFVRDGGRYSAFWRVLMTSPTPACPFDFIPQRGYLAQMDNIRRFYSQPEEDWFVERPYPFLNERTMGQFVDETVAAFVVIHMRMAELAHNDADTALALLDANMLAGFTPPLGDGQWEVSSKQ